MYIPVHIVHSQKITLNYSNDYVTEFPLDLSVSMAEAQQPTRPPAQEQRGGKVPTVFRPVWPYSTAEGETAGDYALQEEQQTKQK